MNPVRHAQCPAADDRLDIFRREWIGIGQQPELYGAKNWPGALNVNKDGLREAAAEVAAFVQTELHALPSPLRPDDAYELWTARRWYLQALIFLESNRLAKAVEASVSPGGQPLAICLGSSNPYKVQTVRGILTMQGTPGCLSTFPDAPYGPGVRWPRWCLACQTRKTNRLNAAKSALRRRVGASWKPRV